MKYELALLVDGKEIDRQEISWVDAKEIVLAGGPEGIPPEVIEDLRELTP